MSDNSVAEHSSGGTDMRPYLENWYRKTKNPLYAWEAISRCLGSGLPIPDWAADYLRQAAINMTMLGWRRDFREDPASEIDSDQAMGLVGQALGLSAERKKNAFARRASDGEAARAGLDDEYHGRGAARENLNQSRNIEADRADRIIRKGRKLNTLTE